MKINPHIFRGYDLRGLVDQDLNPEIVEHLGRAYGTFLSKRNIKKAVVGHDCRLTSESYSKALIKGIINTGVGVVDIGLALAGNIYWAQYYLRAQGCVSVSASHNPAEYNGFKFGTGYSQTMVSEEIQELRAIAEKGNFAQGRGQLKKQDIKEAYFQDLIKKFSRPLKFKVVVDPGHSTAGSFVPELLQRMGCEVIASHCQLNGNFPVGTPDPTEKTMMERLAKKVKAEKADLGFSYDSDGDRVGVVDGQSRILWNDILVALFAADAINQHPGAKIIYNTLGSKVVENVINEKNGRPIMVRTGHSFVKAKFQKEKADFAGELSGHFYFSDFYPHDDGCYSTLKLLNYLSQTKQTLSQAIAKMPKYISSPEIKIGCPDNLKVGLMDKIARKLRKDYPTAEIIDDERAGDGVRLDFETAMFVIRYSQNGPYLTIKFEARAQKKYDELKKYISELLRSYHEIDWDFGINVDSLK